jgi:hypothetical protein
VDAFGESLNALLQKNGPIEVRYSNGKLDWLRSDDPQKFRRYGCAR